ncbi:MAG: decarboxylating 6-phosphogluconate dehydrogenase [Patescibacteria group bacterium]
MTNKEFGLVGLGKMGGNMARRMIDQGWKVVGQNRTLQVAKDMEKEGLTPVETYKDMVAALPAPRLIWLMLPAGDAVEEAIFGADGLASLMQAGDTIVDGGNSFFKDAAPRAEKLKEKGIRYLDCGTSGGPGGARNGACLMVGGSKEAFADYEQLFRDFGMPDGCQFFEGAGAGHFVKMVHNGIEYGMMQAIAEGFAIMKNSSFNLDLLRVCDIYQHGSVIESRLVGWMKSAYVAHGPDMDGVTGSPKHTGEGAWTVETGKEMGIPTPVISDALQFRIDAAANPSYTGQLVSGLREQFGGHSIK